MTKIIFQGKIYNISDIKVHKLIKHANNMSTTIEFKKG